jgi:hypothetical protein
MSCGEEKTKSEVETTIELLPDDLRCHILSFLPTRDAAATSLLSKRWKPLWLSLRSFEFNNRYYTDFGKFSDIVISVLSSRHSVQSLRLTCHSSDPFKVVDVNHFLYKVALQGIPELHLCLFTYSTILPNGFCKNLVTLDLHYASLNYFSCVDFPLIKSLSLIFVKFESHAIMFKFLSGCPNLEYLDARHLDVSNRDIPPPAEEIAEALPKLVRAKINHSSILGPCLVMHGFCAYKWYKILL